MLNFLNIRGGTGGLIFKLFFNFFQKLNPPPPGEGGVKFMEQIVLLDPFLDLYGLLDSFTDDR